jgi:membrane-anchored mycosin MYCP
VRAPGIGPVPKRYGAADTALWSRRRGIAVCCAAVGVRLRTALTGLLLAASWSASVVTGGSPASADQCVTTPDAAATNLWALHRLQPERAWPLTTGAGVTVAVIDSGVSAGIPALSGRVDSGPDLLDDGGSSMSDCSGHGSLVAGIIAGSPVGSDPFHGVAPGARIMSIRQNVQLPGESPQGTTTGLAEAVRYAADHGAEVVNISSTSVVDDPALRTAVQYAQEKDVVVVAAAGNDDLGLSADHTATTYYPAAYPGVLAVAGTDANDQRVDTSHVASYVAIAAPGKDVVSTGPNGPGKYAVVTGTSFATPFVAGVAALVRAYRPTETAKQVIARLEATADPPPGGNAGIGAGIVDPYLAVTALLPAENGVSQTSAPAVRPAALPTAAPVAARGGVGPAVLGAVAALGVIGAVLGMGLWLPRGRARRWRPGRRGF